jgi:putative MFS transporter
VQGRIFVIGGLGYMFDAWDVVLNGYLTPLVGASWHLSTGERSLVATANLLGMAVGAVVWGTVADRVGRRKAFSLTLLVFALFSVLAALSTSFGMFAALRVLAGFGLGGCIPVDYAIVSEFSPARLRGRVLAAMDVWWPIGGTLCGLVATSLVPVHEGERWRWMLAFMVLPALLLFWVRRGVPESPLYLARTGREVHARTVIDDLVARTGAAAEPYSIAPPTEPRKLSPMAAFTQLAAVWRYSPRVTAIVWVLFVTVLVEYYAALTWMPSILRKQGYGDYAAFAGTTLMTGVGVVGVLVSAWLCEVYGRKWVIGLSGVLASIALVLFALMLDDHVPALIWLTVFGFLIEFTIPVLYAYGSELYPTHMRASGFGWASAVGRFATSLGPWIFGTLLWPAFGLPMTFTIVGACVCAAMLWMSLGAPETMGRELDAPALQDSVAVPNPTRG